MTSPEGQKPDELDRVDVTSAAEWGAWLEAHHDSAPGVWLRLFRKGASDATLTYGEAVEVALCFGWIDGQVKKLGRRLASAAVHTSAEAEQLVQGQRRTG